MCVLAAAASEGAGSKRCAATKSLLLPCTHRLSPSTDAPFCDFPVSVRCRLPPVELPRR